MFKILHAAVLDQDCALALVVRDSHSHTEQPLQVQQFRRAPLMSGQPLPNGIDGNFQNRKTRQMGNQERFRLQGIRQSKNHFHILERFFTLIVCEECSSAQAKH